MNLCLNNFYAFSGTGNGGSSEIFHGHHVIYHPQGAGSPVVPPNRCFLQPRSSSTRSPASSSSAGNNLQISSSEVSSSSGYFGSTNHNHNNNTGASVAAPTSSSSTVSYNSANAMDPSNEEGQTSSAGGLVNNPCEVYSDDEQDDFTYVNGATTNPDMVHLR